MEKNVNRGLGSLGALVARKPIWVLVASFLVGNAFTLVVPFRIADSIESRSERLW